MTEPNQHIPCLHCGSSNTVYHSTATDVEYFTSVKEYTYHRCAECGVLFIDPVPENELSSIYPANYYSFGNVTGSFSFRVKNYLDKRFFKKILSPIPATTISVLDIGGGTGWLCDLLQKTDKRVTATEIVDIDEQAKAIAEKKGHAYFCGTIESFQSTEKFNVILLLNLIEHVKNPQALLNKAKELLAPGGIIVIKTPNYKSWDARLFKNNCWGGYHCPRHWVIFDKASLTNTVDQSGLHVKQFQYTQGAPFWTVSILHWMHKKKWIRADAQRPLVYHPLFGIISIATATFDFIRKPFAPLSQMFFILADNSNSK